jgi:hypothetical protein
MGSNAREWADSAELSRLRETVEALVREQGRATDVGELLKDGYEALPRCLPGK